jgi:hypothetical protein
MCRKRCMDLVSFETRAEYEWVKERLGSTPYIWTSGQAVLNGTTELSQLCHGHCGYRCKDFFHKVLRRL